MQDRIGAHNEGCPTLTTFTRVLPSVDPLMETEVGALTEGFTTNFTFIWALSGMNSLLFNKV